MQPETRYENDTGTPLPVGPDLPTSSLDEMLSSLRIVAELLAEKSEELEPTWEMAREAEAEIDTLHQIERTLVVGAAGTPAVCLNEVLIKLDIWRTLGPSCDDRDEETARDRLVHSVRDDLERILHADPLNMILHGHGQFRSELAVRREPLTRPHQAN